MDTRSTNAGIHIGNDIWGGVLSSHGVGMGVHPTGTGGALYSIGDDANISLNLFAKGAGPVNIGNASNAINLGQNSTLVTIGTSGGQTLFGGSTAPFSIATARGSTRRRTDTCGTRPSLLDGVRTTTAIGRPFRRTAGRGLASMSGHGRRITMAAGDLRGTAGTGYRSGDGRRRGSRGERRPAT